MTDRTEQADKLNSPCIEFKGFINTNGYGAVRIKDKIHLAHRIAFRLAYPNVHMRDIYCVCHKCDNKKCINPEHLFRGTRIENNKDRDEKLRTVIVYGENNGNSKLKKEDLVEIRYRLNNGDSFASIGRAFNVKWQTIQAIAKGKTWKKI